MMTTDELEAAYAPFVASLRAGGHRAPNEGWNAATVAAHVALGNDLVADVVEQVAAGGAVARFDNSEAVDENRLRAFVEQVGGVGALADAVEQSARRVAVACAGLGADAALTEVPVRIVDGGVTVVDRPLPVGELVDVNAGLHIGSHREQIRALEPPRTAGPPDGFDTYELVILVSGDDPPELDDAASADLHARHLGHFAHLRRLGLLQLSGPLADQPDPSWRGVSLYRTGSLAMARRLAEDDPAVRAGRFKVEVMRLHTARGALVFPPPT